MTPMPDTPVLDVRGVCKSYGGRPAVVDLDLQVERGAICGFLGPNGAGKTTTLRMILGVARPDRGEVRLFGRTPDPHVLRRVGFLPEERGLYKKMTTDAAIAFFARLKGLSARDARQRARTLLEARGLGHAVGKKIKTLSKGMAQKVQILAAIAHEPELVILDEPFSGLDPVAQKELEGLVRDMRDAGATVLFSTHVMEHAERLCDRIVLISRGRKVFDGDVDAALARVPRQVILEVDQGAGLSVVRALAGVRFTSEPGAAAGVERWRLDLSGGVTPQDVLRACVADGAALARFEPLKPHLHEAFVRLVGEANAPVSEAAE